VSGSPIIQDGKLVGAVTHVLVNDSSRGYGILFSLRICWMRKDKELWQERNAPAIFAIVWYNKHKNSEVEG